MSIHYLIPVILRKFTIQYNAIDQVKREIIGPCITECKHNINLNIYLESTKIFVHFCKNHLPNRNPILLHWLLSQKWKNKIDENILPVASFLKGKFKTGEQIFFWWQKLCKGFIHSYHQNIESLSITLSGILHIVTPRNDIH